MRPGLRMRLGSKLSFTRSVRAPEAGAMFGPDQKPYLRFAFANLEAEHMAPLAERLVASQE